MGLVRLLRSPAFILKKTKSIAGCAVLGVSVSLMLVLAAACGDQSIYRPNVTVTSFISPSPTPNLHANTTNMRKEEKVEATPGTEENQEPAPIPAPLDPVKPGGDQRMAPVPGADITKNGAAATIHGSPAIGKTIFAQNCQECHNTDGKGGIPNPGSTDGTVPSLNPIDPAFITASNRDPAVFAREIDLFIQHGSRPDGPSPVFSMIPWGDHGFLTQQQIADVEAYVMSLNGVTWNSK